MKPEITHDLSKNLRKYKGDLKITLPQKTINPKDIFINNRMKKILNLNNINDKFISNGLNQHLNNQEENVSCKENQNLNQCIENNAIGKDNNLIDGNSSLLNEANKQKNYSSVEETTKINDNKENQNINLCNINTINENNRLDENSENINELEELCEQEIKNATIQKLLLNGDFEGIKQFTEKFESCIDIKKKALSEVDLRGNTPVLLCILLYNNKHNEIYLEILQYLLANGANYKLKDKNDWTPLSIAISYKDRKSVRILYNYYTKRRVERMNNMLREVKDYFYTMKDFYVELKWKVSVPIFSFLCPNDSCIVHKRGCELRTDYTFVDFKSLKTIRNPNSYLLKLNEEIDALQIYKCDRKKKEYFNWIEPLEDDEIDLILEDIMSKKRMNGSFKLLECKLKESQGFFNENEKVFEDVHGWRAQKYELALKIKLDRNPTETIEYFDLNEDNYLNINENIIKSKRSTGENDLKAGLEDGFHIKNTQFSKSFAELEKEKKLKAYVWVVHNSPIKSEDAVKLLNSIAPANEFFDKVKDFFEHPDIVKIINENGFPIKIQIPYNFFIDFTFSFDKYRELESGSKELTTMYDFLNDCTLKSRKGMQNLKENYKIRTGYANIR